MVALNKEGPVHRQQRDEEADASRHEMVGILPNLSHDTEKSGEGFREDWRRGMGYVDECHFCMRKKLGYANK